MSKIQFQNEKTAVSDPDKNAAWMYEVFDRLVRWHVAEVHPCMFKNSGCVSIFLKSLSKINKYGSRCLGLGEGLCCVVQLGFLRLID